jgi:hypothetical protein
LISGVVQGRAAFPSPEVEGQMKPLARRVAKLEARMPPTEPEFVCWKGNPWTEEQMAEAKRRQPDVKFFWRSLQVSGVRYQHPIVLVVVLVLELAVEGQTTIAAGP